MNNEFYSGFANPFLPLDIYIPDGEPKVFDGRVYLYGSKDLFDGEYCCHKYHVYSASVDNLELWTDHGPVFASANEYADEGIKDGVPWSDGLLWAPDVVKKDEWYYLYFCLSDGSEGVARSKFPYGPFHDAKRITMDGKAIEGIDPSVLQDGDDFYYTWGQGHCHMAKLNDDMCSLDSDTYAESLISNEHGQQGFHEGSSLRKIGDKYCIIYASEYTDSCPNNGGKPTSLDYAVSDSIYGPYKRAGRIIDNDGIDPQTWNNHGSIIKINNQWYVFYHASSNNTRYNRRCRVERIEVDEKKALIKQAAMTSSGFADTLQCNRTIEAAWAYNVTGGAYFTERGHKHPMINVKNSCSVSWRYINIKESTLTINGRGLSGGSMHILLNGKETAVSDILPGDTVWNIKINDNIKNAVLTITFESEHDKDICEIDSLIFE